MEKVHRKYRGRALDFRDADCIRMVRTYLVALGHRPPKLPKYGSLMGAKRALKTAGFDTVEALLDSILPRRPAPAFRQFGDLVLMAGDQGLDSVTICIGHKVMGWWEGECRTDIIPIEVKAAYCV